MFTAPSHSLRSQAHAPAQPPRPRLDDEDEDEDEPFERPEKNGAGGIGAQIQKKFLEQRKIFLWGAVTDQTAKDIT